MDAKSELYREYCIQDGHLNACSVSNTPRGVLGNRNNRDMCRIRVDESQIREEKIAPDLQIFGYTYGRDLNHTQAALEPL